MSDDYREMVEAWMRRIDAVGISQAIREIATPDVKLVNPDRVDDLDGAIARLAEVERAFPDAEVVLQDVIAEGNRLVVIVELSGTHRGPLRNIPPTNRPVRFSTAFVIYLRDGRAERFRMFPEFFSAMSQIGMLAPFQPPESLPPSAYRPGP
jgi:predicted ester cyclase